MRPELRQTLNVKGLPGELMRGLHMVSARRRVPIRVWLILELYRLVDRELGGEDWRYESRPGGELAMASTEEYRRGRGWSEGVRLLADPTMRG